MANRIDVRALRERAGKNRDDFGKLVGSSGRTIRRWENDEAEPSAMALKLLDALSVQLTDDDPAAATGPRRKSVTA